MNKLYLQNIVDDISFENLPVKWQGFDFIRFSENKRLFKFQQDALIYALNALHLYFKDRNSDKQKLFNYYKLNGLEENFDYDLKKKEGKKTANIVETLSNLTGKWIKKVSDSEIEFEDGTKINTKDLDYKLIKPLIWWG